MEAFRVSKPLKMSMFSSKKHISDEPGHFYAGEEARFVGRCVCDRGAFSFVTFLWASKEK